MKTIHQYALALQDGSQEIIIPSNAHILCVADQNGYPTLWIQVDPESQKTTIRTFLVYGTGQPINNSGTYLGSAIGPRSAWHVYEVSNPKNPNALYETPAIEYNENPTL